MQRALSSGEEGRRGQRAYASFMHSSGGSLDLVSMMRLSQCTELSYFVSTGNTGQYQAWHNSAHCHCLSQFQP